MDVSTTSSINIELVTAGAALKGDFARVTVTTPLTQLTGYLGFALDGVVLDSSVEARLEQDATFDVDAGALACP
jgi:hypothetical protein